MPISNISPDKIFSNQVGVIDINFFNPQMPKEGTDGEGNKFYYMDENNDGSFNTADGDYKTQQSTAYILRDTVAKWYYSLRNFALIGLLSVLVYIGIRIIISSTANEKAKYKSMIKDWVVAICLLYVLHYIMVFSISIVEKITDAIGKNTVTVVATIKNKKLADTVDKEAANIGSVLGISESDVKQMVDTSQELVAWPTDFVGLARIELQQLGDSDDETISVKAGYTIIYLVLIFFTMFYLVYYIKRVIYMAFLTLIAPLITLTYPIDKINDGKSQGFDIWLKEYMYNLLIQPFHLILYTILVSSSLSFAKDNIIYTCVALGFMMPAEKLLRKMFNFNRAETANAFSGAAAGALVGNALGKMTKLAGSAVGKKVGKKTTGGDENNTRIRTTNNGLNGWTSDEVGSGENNPLRLSNNNEITDSQNSTLDNNTRINSLNQNRNTENNEQNLPSWARGGTELSSGIILPAGIDTNINNEQNTNIGADNLEDNSLLNNGLNNYAIEDDQQNLDNSAETERALNQESDKDDRNLSQALAAYAAGRRKKVEDKMRNNKKIQQMAEELNKKREKAKESKIAQFGKQLSDMTPQPLKNSLKTTGKGIINIPIKGAKNIGKAVFKRENIGKVARFAVKGGVAAIGAGIGATVGIATGDIKNVGQYGALGGAAGWAAGTAAGNVGSSGAGFIKDAYMEGAYGKEEAARRKEMEELAKEKKIEEYVSTNHPELKYQERKVTEKKMAEYMVDTGVRDMDIINKAMKLESEDGLTTDQAKSMAYEANRFKDRKSDLLNPETRKGVEKSLSNRLYNYLVTEKHIEEGEARQRADTTAKKKMKNLDKMLDLS